MKPVLPLWTRFALVLPMASLAAAQTLPDAVDPDTPVPSTTYRSVFADTPAGVEQERTDWKKANAEVGQFRRGHVDILKSEAKPTPTAAPSVESTAPASSASPVPRPASPAHHRH